MLEGFNFARQHRANRQQKNTGESEEARVLEDYNYVRKHRATSEPRYHHRSIVMPTVTV